MSDQLREEILSLVKKHHNEAFNKGLVAGESYIPTSGKVFGFEEMQNLVDASLDFWLTEGRFNEQFERKLAEFMDVNFCTTVNSGSSANLLAFYALTSREFGSRAIKKGDEIIEAATCFPTTLNPVIQFGCTPVLVDVDIPTYNASAKKVLSAVTDKTKAIFLAHTLGNPYEVEEIASFCKERGIWLIEDCCDALGATYNGKKVGSFGDVATLSFYPAHQITCGEGGAVLTNDALLNKMVRSFRDWGRDCWCAPGDENTCGIRFNWQLGTLPKGYDHKYIYSHIGFNLKMTDLQASVGLAQMNRVEGFIEKRRENHRLLTKYLKRFEDYFILPKATENSNPSWFGYVITIKDQAPFNRNNLINYLEDHKIGTRLLFAGNITRQPAYKDVEFKIHGDLINADKVMNNTFWIGCYPAIDEDIIKYISNTFGGFISLAKKGNLNV